MILVTGHLGFIGRHLTRYLDANGRAWIGADRRPSQRGQDLATDIRDLRALQLARLDVTSIVHLASPVGVTETSRTPARVRQEIVDGAARMAIVARELGAPLLYVSSSEVFGEPPGAITATTSPAPISGYGRGKLEAEKIVLSGCDGAVVRLFNVYGAGQRLGFFVSTVLHAFRSGNPVPIVGGGRPIRQFTYVGDIARALVDASWAAHPGSVICLAGPDALSLREAVRIAGEVADVVPRLITVTPQALNRLERSEVRTRRLVRPLPAWMAPWRAETTFRTGIRLTLADTLNGVEHA